MKLKHILLAAVAMTLGVMTTACNEKEQPPMGVYQEYAIRDDNGALTAMANLRENTSDGKRVRTVNPTDLKCNGRVMYFSPELYPNDPPFNYSTTLDPNTDEVKFTLNTTAGTLINIAKLSYYPLPSYDFTNQEDKRTVTVQNGKILPLNMNSVKLESFSITLTPADDLGQSSTVYMAEATNTSFYFFQNVPKGKYKLHLNVNVLLPTQMNDGTSSGLIWISRRVSYPAVVE